MSRIPNPPKLAQEINIMIIDHLNADKASLKACSQVAPFHQISRHHLFQTIMIPFSDSKSDTILGFINLLYSPTQIGVHIRCLDLHIPYDIFCQPFNTRLGRPTRDIEVITAILSMLPNLTTFTLSGVRPAQPNAPKSNVSITNSTRRLSVLLDNIGAGHDIQLDSLTEFDFSFSNSGQLPIASHTIRLAPNLRCLTLRLIPNEVFYEPPGV